MYTLQAQADGSLTLTIEGQIDQAQAAQIAKQLQAADSPTELTVKLNSPGGEVEQGMAIAKALEATGATITTEIGPGHKAESMAAFLFLSGKQRLMAADATLAFHGPGLTGCHTRLDKKAAGEILQQLDKAERELAEYFGTTSGLGAETVAGLMTSELDSYDQEKALEAGLATGALEAGGPQKQRQPEPAASAGGCNCGNLKMQALAANSQTAMALIGTLESHSWVKVPEVHKDAFEALLIAGKPDAAMQYVQLHPSRDPMDGKPHASTKLPSRGIQQPTAPDGDIRGGGLQLTAEGKTWHELTNQERLELRANNPKWYNKLFTKAAKLR